jgi:hypothetical protein
MKCIFYDGLLNSKIYKLYYYYLTINKYRYDPDNFSHITEYLIY